MKTVLFIFFCSLLFYRFQLRAKVGLLAHVLALRSDTGGFVVTPKLLFRQQNQLDVVVTSCSNNSLCTTCTYLACLECYVLVLLESVPAQRLMPKHNFRHNVALYGHTLAYMVDFKKHTFVVLRSHMKLYICLVHSAKSIVLA